MSGMLLERFYRLIGMLIAIEQDNSNTRHHLGRMAKRTKVVSKTKEMVAMTLALWCALTSPSIFDQYQKLAMSSFK